MYASITTTRGSNEGMAELAAMTGETLIVWLRDIEGFTGLLMLSNQESGTTHVISFWESKEVADRHLDARLRFRDRVTATIDVEVQETASYDVTFASLPPIG